VSLAVGPLTPPDARIAAPEMVTGDLPTDPQTAMAPETDRPGAPPPEDKSTATALPETASDTPPVRFEESTDTPPSASTPPDPARRPATETDVATPPADTLASPSAEPAQTLAEEATQPATMPDAALESGSLPMPGATDPGTGVAVATEAPVMPSLQAALPTAPGAEAEPSIATEPAQPPQPQVPSEQSGLVADATSEMSAESADQETDAIPTDAVTPDAADTPQNDRVAGMSAATGGTEAVQDPATTATAPGLAGTPNVRVLTPPDAGTEGTNTDDTGRLAIGTPGVSLVERAAVPEGRLPSVGAPSETDTGAAEATTPGAPLIDFAAPVEVAADLPRMAIVLIDDGSGPLGPDALDSFPFPVTFALDPAQAGATDRMQGYRDQGFEVMALAGVPDGAQPTDVEVTLESVLASLPQAVAVLENPSQGLQGSRAISDQVTAVLRGSGHGLVLQPKGLNTATALAAREGVPAASVFKDFDGEGQDPRAIRRFLDGAAFRARQDGAVIVMGRLKADTLSALLLWGLQDRANQIALVPVSLVLREAAGL
jgi:hypothetical protein